MSLCMLLSTASLRATGSRLRANKDPKIGDARSARVRFLLNVIGLSRTKLAKKHGIPVASLCVWSQINHRRSTLTYKAAKRLVEVARKEEVVCDVLWLLKGQGPPPTITSRYFYKPEIGD